jgi:predicted membrane metal-binding protein
MWHAGSMSTAPAPARERNVRPWLRGKRALLGAFLIAFSLGLIFVLWQRQQHLEREQASAARAATQRASIDAFEVQVRALVERQRVELEALKADAHSWDEPTRERVRQLELKFQAAQRDAETLIAEQRRQLGVPAAAASAGAAAPAAAAAPSEPGK